MLSAFFKPSEDLKKKQQDNDSKLAQIQDKILKHPIYENIKLFGEDALKHKGVSHPKDILIYKEGLKCFDWNLKMEAMIAGRNGKRLNTRDIGSLLMCLPEETIQQKLKQFGISDATKPVLFNEKIPLTTKVISPEGNSVSVVFCGKDLRIAGTETILGYMKYQESEHICFPNHLWISIMNNTSEYKHVGLALHEAAFRISLSMGYQGKIGLDASYSSHAFHFISGYRFLNSACFPSIANAMQIKEFAGLVHELEEARRKMQVITKPLLSPIKLVN